MGKFAALTRAGAGSGLKLHAFKGTKTLLPRVKKVLGFLRGLDFGVLVDLARGRGAFLVPFLAQFPDARAAAVEPPPGRLAAIAPTLLDVMGQACPPEMDGKSLIER